MTLLLLLRKLQLPPPAHSPPFSHLTITPFSLLLSSASAISPPQAPPLNPQSFSADYLIRSCGLSSDEAVRAYEKIHHLKSPDKPDAVLRFLTEIGISESDIRRAVSRDARILCSSVDKNLRPNATKLQEVGLSIEEISGIIYRSPNVFRFNFAPKIDFWMGVLGTGEILSFALKRSAAFLNMNLDNVAVPNLSFLREQCGLSTPQICQLIKLNPRLISSSTETLKIKAKRADQLGIARSSGTYMYALHIVATLNERMLDARLNNLRSLSFSGDEVTILITRSPLLVTIPEVLVARKMEFLTKEAGCDKIDVLRYPSLLSYSLEKRLIPRNLVRKLLKLKEHPVAYKKFSSFARPTVKKFVERFILPYERDIPGLHEAYADASAGNMVESNGVKSLSS